MSPLNTSENDWSSLLLRLGVALASGALIGWERQTAGKSAGFRTHMLVSVGAAIFVMTALEQSVDSASRVVQGVAAGVGFLGAGEILHLARNNGEKAKVKGLTSAAAIWVAAALGTSAGYGSWRLAFAGSVITLFILTVARKLEVYIIPKGPGGEDGA
jgi:putative Mg2+ transporter-C (MgtC) family protein